MRSVKFFVIAGAASLLSSMASAADMAIAPPPMPYAPPVADFGGWYLRGDVGFSNQSVGSIRNTNAALYSNLNSFQETTGFDTGGIYQLGAGYQFNHWFRVDVTGQYRGAANFHGLDLISYPAGGGVTGYGADVYNASKSEWLFLANAYVDLGTWWCITPYIGAGIGTARVQVANFTDSGVVNNGAGAGPSLVSAATGSQWNFAWAVHAGLAYQVTPNMAIDLSYSYVNLGNGTTGIDGAFDGSVGGHVFQFNNITSQDVMLGVRWNFWSPPAYAPPLITKG
ncbi:outer membrane protein [Bradyrhizobium sp.]|uniref:outer membrane protein n=1 Tax=Bradyrhizobium sp. TaxID=376 RepID=UPI002395DD79|nr:outer membrane beta-barrel protein [Bradyrhizobium sp.]MDE1935437.1 porin family protein [Bradyrhizobium sp.]MDE2065219.1 porin family protein [Bradyrhizobium sp.]